MPLMSRCNGCGCSVKYRQSYCDKCKTIKKKEDNKKYRLYDNNDEIRKLRHTSKWRKVRQDVIDSQKGLCAMCYVQGKLSSIDHVHHITQCIDDLSLFYNEDNLVGLCEECHKEIHSRKILGKEKLENYLIELNKKSEIKF